MRRANQHIKALDAALDELQNLHPYRIVVQADLKCLGRVEVARAEAQALGVRTYFTDDAPDNPLNIFVPIVHAENVGLYIRVVKPLPSLIWGTMIGDIVHNLRSALDQLIWELSLHYQGRLPTPVVALPTGDTLPRNSPWRLIQFPVCSTPASWASAKTGALRLIDQNLLQKIADEQPFKRGKRYQRHWLWLLNELWNRDKHRSVSIAVTYGVLTGFALVPAAGETMGKTQFLQEFDVQLLSSQSVGRYVDGMKLGQFRVTRKRPGVPEPQVNFDVETTLRLGIKFKKTAPTYGSGVLDALEGLSADVERVLDLFVTDFK